MKNLLIYAGLLVWSITSCRHSDVELSRSIEGTYQAKDYDHFSDISSIAYPINGQELTLQIKYITADTVSVQIIPTGTTSSLPSGVYSPTQTLSYPKAYVESPNKTATYIYLMGKSGSTVSITNPQIWIYSDKNTADYLFTPIQTPAFSKSIRFQKK